MRLSNAEFRAMNGGIRRFFHRKVEFPMLTRLGLSEGADKEMVELGGIGRSAIFQVLQLWSCHC